MMGQRSVEQLRRDALRIWHAGVDAVRSQRLIGQHVRVEKECLHLGDDRIDLREVDRIAVIGAGKACAGMAEAVEQVLGERLMEHKGLIGWVNVPADCVISLRRIHLHAARPAGINEPTEAGAAGAQEILRIVQSLGPRDLCLCLISGGGSALLPAPAKGVTLTEKLSVARHLSASGANIVEINTVRKHLSRIKGGGLARECGAGRMVTLIISDVLGDPLDVIASGPTVADRSTPGEALSVLEKYAGDHSAIPQDVLGHLRQKRDIPQDAIRCRVSNLVIGNNSMAVRAASDEARRLGYVEAAHSAGESEGDVGGIGENLARIAIAMRDAPQGPDAYVSGGEGVVKLIDSAERGQGGRNQQTALAALRILQKQGDARRVIVLSAGTDGEDGPTDAAGAFADSQVIQGAADRGMDAADYLRRNDAYRFFGPLGALVKTGPTHTNVCDLRVVLADR